MHTITSLEELIGDAISSAPYQFSDKKGYNKAVKKVQELRNCLRLLQLGVTKESMLLTKENLEHKIEACLNRIDSETAKYKSINKQIPSKIIKAIKDDFNYSLAFNQIKTINFILNEKTVQ